MPTCSIYGPGNHLLRRFSTQAPAFGESISVGTSSRCAIALGALESSDGVGDFHFSLIRKADGWHVASPGPAIRLKNGRDAQDARLAEGVEISFGTCRLVASADPVPSDHQFLWQVPGGTEVMAGPLHRGANFVGNAEECEIRIDVPGIGAQHCAIRVEDWLVTVEPLDSSDLVLNGRAVTEAVAIRPGDMLTMAGIRACVAGRNAPIRLPEQVSGYALAAWRMANLVLFVALLGVLAYFLRQAIPGGTKDVGEGHVEMTPAELAAAAWADVADGHVEAAMARTRAAHLPETDPLVVALALERDLAARLVRCREHLAMRRDAFQGANFIRILLSDREMGHQLAPVEAYWRNEADALAEGERSLRRHGNTDLVAHSWFLANLAPVQAGVDDMKALVVACRRLHDAWFDRRWDEAVAIFDQLAHAGEAGNEASRALYQTALRRAEFGRDLGTLGKDLAGCAFRTVDLAAMAARREQLEKAFPEMAFLPSEARPVRALLDRDALLINALGAVQTSYRAWRDDPAVATLAGLSTALRQARRDAGGIPVIAAMDVAVQQEIGDWLAPAAASLPTTPAADHLRHCRILMDIALTTSFAARDEVSRTLEAKERKILVAIQQECDRLMGEYQAGQGVLPASLLLQFLDAVLAIAPPEHRYHDWARHEKARLAATPPGTAP